MTWVRILAASSGNCFICFLVSPVPVVHVKYIQNSEPRAMSVCQQSSSLPDDKNVAQVQLGVATVTPSWYDGAECRISDLKFAIIFDILCSFFCSSRTLSQFNITAASLSFHKDCNLFPLHMHSTAFRIPPAIKRRIKYKTKTNKAILRRLNKVMQYINTLPLFFFIVIPCILILLKFLSPKNALCHTLHGTRYTHNSLKHMLPQHCKTCNYVFY
jgi:hypothetical protein